MPSSTRKKRRSGIALIDVGGGTTDLAVFEERTIRHTAVIGIAGKKVTDDIRKGLGILNDQAEKLKREHGCAYVPGRERATSRSFFPASAAGRRSRSTSGCWRRSFSRGWRRSSRSRRWRSSGPAIRAPVRRRGADRRRGTDQGDGRAGARGAGHAGEDRHPVRVLRRAGPRDREPRVLHGRRPGAATA